MVVTFRVEHDCMFKINTRLFFLGIQEPVLTHQLLREGPSVEIAETRVIYISML